MKKIEQDVEGVTLIESLQEKTELLLRSGKPNPLEMV